MMKKNWKVLGILVSVALCLSGSSLLAGGNLITNPNFVLDANGEVNMERRSLDDVLAWSGSGFSNVIVPTEEWAGTPLPPNGIDLAGRVATETRDHWIHQDTGHYWQEDTVYTLQFDVFASINIGRFSVEFFADGDYIGWSRTYAWVGGPSTEWQTITETFDPTGEGVAGQEIGIRLMHFDNWGRTAVNNVIMLAGVEIERVADLSVSLGQEAEIEVEVDAPDYAIGYQWYYSADGRDFEAIQGQQSSSIFIAHAQGSDAGYYRCDITLDDGVEQTTLKSRTASLEVEMPAEIIAQPESLVEALAGDAVFWVDVESQAGVNLAYQWFWSPDDSITPDIDEIIVDAQSDTLFLENIGAVDEGYYYCRIEVSMSDPQAEGYIYSDIVSLEVSLPSQIISQPQSLLLYAQDDATFEIDVEAGGADISYQWYWSADAQIDIDVDQVIGSDSNSVDVFGADLSDEGFYYCQITVTLAGATGYLYSEPAGLGIKRNIGYWTLDSADFVDKLYLDSSGENRHAEALSPSDAQLAFSEGVRGDALNTDNYPQAAAIAGAQSPAEFTGQMTASVWVNWAEAAGSPGILSKRQDEVGAEWWLQISGGSLNLSSWESGSQNLSTSPPPVGQWTHIAFTVDEDGGALFVNGAMVDTGDFLLGGGTGAQLVIGGSHANWNASDISNIFNGLIDEVRIYNYALRAEQIADIYFDLADVLVARQPQDALAFVGETAEFSIEAATQQGVSLSYQWYRSETDDITPGNDTAIGTDSATLVVDDIGSDDEGY